MACFNVQVLYESGILYEKCYIFSGHSLFCFYQHCCSREFFRIVLDMKGWSLLSPFRGGRWCGVIFYYKQLILAICDCEIGMALMRPYLHCWMPSQWTTYVYHNLLVLRWQNLLRLLHTCSAQLNIL